MSSSQAPGSEACVPVQSSDRTIVSPATTEIFRRSQASDETPPSPASTVDSVPLTPNFAIRIVLVLEENRASQPAYSHARLELHIAAKV